MLIYAYLHISLLRIDVGGTYQIHLTHLLLNQVLPSLDSSYPVSISFQRRKEDSLDHTSKHTISKFLIHLNSPVIITPNK
jgi:hypothetical protein